MGDYVSGEQNPDHCGDSDRSVSRRRFVQTVGASGVAVGVAGCISGGSNEQKTESKKVGEVTDKKVTLQWAASQEEASKSAEINQALHNAGLPSNITVEFLSGSSVSDDRQSQYERWLSADRSKPDLLRMDNGWTIPFIQRGHLLNLSDHLDQKTLDKIDKSYFDMAVETAKGSQGGLFALPLWVGLPTMQYRKDLVEKAGYNPESENWATESISWKKFAQVTRDVLDQNPKMKHGYTFQADVYEGLSCCNYNEFISSWGGAYFGSLDNLFGPVGKRPVTVDEKPVIDSIKMVRTFIHGKSDPHSLDGYEGNISPEAVLSWTEGDSERPFGSGNAVMHRNWPYSVNVNGASDAFGKDLGVMPIPYGVSEKNAKYEGTGGPTAALGGQHVAINPNSKHLAEALEVVKAASKDAFNLEIMKILGQLPPKPKVLDHEKARNVSVVGRYLDTFKVAGQNAVPRPVTVAWPDESAKIAEAVNATYSQDKSPSKAMSDLKETLVSIENSI